MSAGPKSCSSEMPTAVDIVPWSAAARGDRQVAELDRIFFVSSATQSFPSEAHRRAFRERWFGRYLSGHLVAHAFLAVDAADLPLGYVVGALADPARDARFADIGYWPAFADLTARYPAHLHINVAPEARSLGIGARLVEAFADHARLLGSPGLHVVTGASSRNRGFYARRGFQEGRSIDWNGVAIAMLVRNLQGASRRPHDSDV